MPESEAARWEYMAVQVDWRSRHEDELAGHRFDRYDAIEAVLNQLGEEGWEAVGIEASASWRVLLKRRLTDRPVDATFE
jgi:hypothetical protein